MHVVWCVNPRVCTCALKKQLLYRLIDQCFLTIVCVCVCVCVCVYRRTENIRYASDLSRKFRVQIQTDRQHTGTAELTIIHCDDTELNRTLRGQRRFLILLEIHISHLKSPSLSLRKSQNVFVVVAIVPAPSNVSRGLSSLKVSNGREEPHPALQSTMGTNMNPQKRKPTHSGSAHSHTYTTIQLHTSRAAIDDAVLITRGFQLLILHRLCPRGGAGLSRRTTNLLRHCRLKPFLTFISLYVSFF